MINAARKAAKGLRRDLGEIENLQVSRKGPADFVTVADQRTEKLVVDELARARPHYSILTEERGLVEGPDSSHRFIVDPLDGTTNFIHGIPHVAISIALEREGELVAGVVYNPLVEDLFVAERTKGAFLNGKRIRVSGRGVLADSLIATGLPFKGRGDHPRALAEVERVIAVTSGVRRFGAASLDLAWVAAGRYDGFWERGLQPWDIAAGIVLVREAGGIVAELDGGRDVLATGAILASNESLHRPLKETLSGARP